MTRARLPSLLWRTVSISAACLIIGVALLALVAIALMHTDHFQSAFVRYAAARLSRHVDIKGALDLDLFSSSPSLTATDVTLSNPSWMPPGEVAHIGRLTVVFDFPWPGRKKTIRRLELLSAQLHLVRDGEGRAN